jgi:hypothetical protein
LLLRDEAFLPFYNNFCKKVIPDCKFDKKTVDLADQIGSFGRTLPEV